MSEQLQQPIEQDGSVSQALPSFQSALTTVLHESGLPVDNVLVSVDERKRFISNLNETIQKIDANERRKSIYLSKLIAAVGCGLFDAALNYLWNETVLILRERVKLYDLDYFFDNVVSDPVKRKTLSGPEDLKNLSDYDLLRGCKEIGIITEIGFKHLEYINFMRNWASAAHPNNSELTGLNLISWLDTCVREVMNPPLTDIVVRVKHVLSNIKKNSLSKVESESLSDFFKTLNTVQISNLLLGFWGIYTNTKGTPNQVAIDNIKLLAPSLWRLAPDSVKTDIGISYSTFVVNAYMVEKRMGEEFFNIVGGHGFIAPGVKIVEISNQADNLINSHRSFNNFYNEPPQAIQLKKYLENGIPEQIQRKVVFVVTECFITNGYGIARDADPVYKEIMSKYDGFQSTLAILSLRRTSISSKLSNRLCLSKYVEMVDYLKPKVAIPEVNDFINRRLGSVDLLIAASNDYNLDVEIDALTAAYK